MTTLPVKLNTFTIVNDYFLRNIVKLRNSTAWIQRTGHNELLTAHDLLLSLKKYDKRIPVNVNTLNKSTSSSGKRTRVFITYMYMQFYPQTVQPYSISLRMSCSRQIIRNLTPFHGRLNISCPEANPAEVLVRFFSLVRTWELYL